MARNLFRLRHSAGHFIVRGKHWLAISSQTKRIRIAPNRERLWKINWMAWNIVRACRQDQLALAVEADVRWSMHQLLKTPERNRAVQEGRAQLVGAVLESNSGQVRFLS